MCRRLSTLGCFVLGLGLIAGRCQADDLREPVLGRVELIGKLTALTAESSSKTVMAEPAQGTVQLFVNVRLNGTPDEVAAAGAPLSITFAPAAEPLPKLGQAILLASLIELETDAVPEMPELGQPILLASVVEAEHDAVPTLHAVPMALDGLGIDVDAISWPEDWVIKLQQQADILDLIPTFQKTMSKYDAIQNTRTLGDIQLSEMIQLRTELERLQKKTSDPQSQVQVNLKVIRVQYQVEAEKLTNEERGIRNWEQVEQLIKSGKAHVIHQPTLRASSNQQVEYRDGGEKPTRIQQIGGNTNREFGITVQAMAVALAEKRYSMILHAQLADHNVETDAIDSSRVNTTLEVAAGQTYIVGGDVCTRQKVGEPLVGVSGTLFAVSVEPAK